MMLSDMCNHKIGSVFDQLIAAQASLQAALQNPVCSAGTLETTLEAAGRDLLRGLLEPALQALADTVEPHCPKCHQTLHIEARARPRTITTVFGPVRFLRDYGWCRHCQQWFFPADQRLGLAPNAPASPRVQEMAALLTLKMPPAQAEAVMERVTGLSLSRSTLDRETHRQGLRAQAVRDRQAALTQTPGGVAALAAEAQAGLPQEPFTLVIELDAFNIRERDHWGQTQQRLDQGLEISRWHWVYTGTCFRLDQRGTTAGERPVITQRGYVTTRLGLEEFDRQLYAEALQRGLLQARKVLVIADGAAWIWNWAQDRFQYANHRLDLWHLKEHLWTVANEIHGEGTPEAAAWVKPLFQQLENQADGAARALSRLEQLKITMTQLTQNQQTMLEKEIQYFRTNQNRMDYAAGKKAGEPLGSGAIESTCRQYQCRFKRSGQFWSLEGDEALLALETLYRNDRWHLLFPHIESPTPMNNN